MRDWAVSLILTGSDFYGTMAIWLSNRDAADVLGLNVRQLRRLRAKGVLLPGVHWHRFGTDKRSKISYEVEGCRQALQAQTLLNGG